jgi:hypothetical protein
MIRNKTLSDHMLDAVEGLIAFVCFSLQAVCWLIACVLFPAALAWVLALGLYISIFTK